LEASDEELSFDFRAGRRVAVTKKEKGTGYSARILASDEMPQAGEQEALLVPRRGQVQFS
jgi:branched-subunit amino acid aminotransferase/4-amino-4-deoxychorismate lyase